MRHLLVTASALTLLLAGGAAFAQSGQGGSLGKNPADISTSPPTQGTGGPGNSTYAYPGISNSGGSGAAIPSGQGGVNDPSQSQSQGNTTYDTPGKVGGSSHR